MPVIPHPYGTRASGPSLGRMEYRPSTLKMTTVEELRRDREEIERAFRAGDDALTQIEARLRALEATLLP